MSKSRSIISALALSASLGFLLPACSSDGVTRVSAIGPQGSGGQNGQQGPQGEQGPAGPQGPQGQAGADGTDGANGADGADGNVNLGDAGTLAVGGLVGPNGVAGTGLLANTGDPDNTNETLSAVLTQTGEEISSASVFIASAIDETVPGGVPLTGTVLGVLDETGQTLVQTANGDAYLVDGLLAAPGDLITATVGGARAIGSEDTDALIALNTLSEQADMGQLATVGVGSGGDLATADIGGLLDSVTSALNADPLDVGGTLNSILPDQDLVSISDDSSLGVTIADGLPGAENIAIVDTVTGGLDPVLGGTDGLTGALEPVLAGGGLEGALDPVLDTLGGGDLGGGLDPVLDPLTGGGDLGGGLDGALDPVLDPLTGDDGLLGDALDPVTGEDGLLGGLLGGGN